MYSTAGNDAIIKLLALFKGLNCKHFISTLFNPHLTINSK